MMAGEEMPDARTGDWLIQEEVDGRSHRLCKRPG